MDQKKFSFFKNRKYKRVIFPFCLTLLLGMIMMFSMPTVAKSEVTKPYLTPDNFSFEIRDRVKMKLVNNEIKADGVHTDMVSLTIKDTARVWDNNHEALLQAGGVTATFTFNAWTPADINFAWSWYSPYISYEKYNGLTFVNFNDTPIAKVVLLNALGENSLNFYENKGTWVTRTLEIPIDKSADITTIMGNIIQPPNNIGQWGNTDYGHHNTNAFTNVIMFLKFNNIHYPTVTLTNPTASEIISGQTLADSNIAGGKVVSVNARDTIMTDRKPISGTYKWQTPNNDPITATTTFSAEFDTYYANFSNHTVGISVPVRAADVTLDKNGGTGENDIASGWFNSLLGNTTIPTKTGYDFKGYFSASTGGTQYYNSLGVGVKNWDIAADTTLYAQWETSLSVAAIAAPSAILTGSKLNLTNPTVVGTTTAKGWEISANGTTHWIGFNPAVKTFSASETQYSIRYYATNGTYTAYSNTVKITVNKNASALIIEADTVSTAYPGNILLTATLSGVDNFTGKKVYFYDGENQLGERNINSEGVTNLSATNPTPGNHSYSVRFEGDTENSSVSSTNINVTVSKGKQAVVTFESTADINKTYGAADFTLPTVSGGSGTGGYSYRSDNSEVATLSGNTVSIRGAGEATIYVKRNGDTNYNDSTEAAVKVIVAHKAVTIGGIIANDKVYDGNDNAEIGTGSPSLEGIINFDDVQIDYTNALAKFADHNAASSISVSFSGFSLKGTKAGNYVLTAQPAGVYAEIYQREIKISGITAKNKLYDGTQTAVLNLGNVVFNNIIDGDSLSLSATGNFEDANAGIDKIVYIENIVLGGTSVDNYYISSGFKKAMILTQTTTTTSIYPKAIVITPDAGQSKNYGQPDGVLTFTNPGYILEEIAGFTGYLGRTAGETVGSYPINLGTLALADNGAFKAANYIINLSGAIASYTINSVLATADDYTVTGNQDAWNNQDLTITPRGDYAQISTDKINWSNSIILSVEGDPSTVEFYLKQTDGTTTEKATYTYKLDKTAPTGTISQAENSWTKFLNNITFGLFFKDTQTVTISGADVDGSGIASIAYYILEVEDNKVNLETTLDQAKAYTYTEGTEFNISPDKNVVVFAKIVDNAGNVTYINSQGMVFDETAPVIAGITNGQTYYTTRELIITDTNLNSITINGDDLIGNTIPGDVDMTYVVVATDKAGNSTTYTVTMKSINSLSSTIDSLNETNVKSSDKGTIETVKANVAAVNIDSATQAEKDKLQEITDKCDTLLTKISNIANEIEAVITKLGDTTASNGKSSDSVRLGEVKIELERLLATDNLTDGEKANLETKLTITNEGIAEIAKVATEISAVITKLGETTATNGKSSDSTRLGEVKTELERLIATDNLTDKETASLEGTLKVTDEAIAEITKVATEISVVTTKLGDTTATNGKSSDSVRLGEVKIELERLLATKNLTDDEKANLETKLTITNEAIAEIAKVASEISAVITKLGDTTAANGESSDSIRLGEVKIELERLIATNNLTDGEKANLETKLTITNEAIAEITKVATEISAVITKLGDTTAANGKSSDSVRLGEVKIELERLLATDNLTEKETVSLEGTLKVTNEGIAEIAKVATEISEVTTKLGDTTAANGKSSDSTRLVEVKTELERLLPTDNLTEEETASIEGTLKVTNEAIAEITKVATEISGVITKLGDTTAANGKSSDSTRLGEVKTELERLLATDNLTDKEITNIETKLTITNEAIAKIDEVEKNIANALAPISNITENNVIKTDGSKLIKGINDLQKILVDYANNLTDAEKAMINTQIKKIQDIRKVLDEVKTVEDLIIALPNDIEKARDSFNKLSVHQQKLIDSALLTKLDEFLNPIMKSVIIHEATGIKIEGINGTVFNPRTILVLTPIIDTEGFAILDENQEMLQLYDIKFLLDGIEIQPEGNIKITLKLTAEQQEYQDLKVVFIAEDGAVTIMPSEINGDEVSFITDHFSHYGIIGTKVNVSSGDNSMVDTLEIIAYIVLASIAVTATAIIIIKKREENTNNQTK